jgi:hypothetical protein
MSKIAGALLVLGAAPLAVLTASLAFSGCAGTATSTPMNCTAYTPDAGTDPNLTCAIGWACNSGDTILQLTCTQDVRPEYYDCSCSNGTTTTQSIVVDTFICDAMGSLPTANMGCNFGIQP